MALCSIVTDVAGGVPDPDAAPPVVPRIRLTHIEVGSFSVLGEDGVETGVVVRVHRPHSRIDLTMSDKLAAEFVAAVSRELARTSGDRFD